MKAKYKVFGILYTSWIAVPLTLDVLNYIIWWQGILFSIIFTLSGIGSWFLFRFFTLS